MLVHSSSLSIKLSARSKDQMAVIFGEDGGKDLDLFRVCSWVMVPVEMKSGLGGHKHQVANSILKNFVSNLECFGSLRN